MRTIKMFIQVKRISPLAFVYLLFSLFTIVNAASLPEEREESTSLSAKVHKLLLSKDCFIKVAGQNPACLEILPIEEKGEVVATVELKINKVSELNRTTEGILVLPAGSSLKKAGLLKVQKGEIEYFYYNTMKISYPDPVNTSPYHIKFWVNRHQREESSERIFYCLDFQYRSISYGEDLHIISPDEKIIVKKNPQKPCEILVQDRKFNRTNYQIDLKEQPSSFSFSPSGKILAVMNMNGNIQIINMNEGIVIYNIKALATAALHSFTMECINDKSILVLSPNKSEENLSNGSFILSLYNLASNFQNITSWNVKDAQGIISRKADSILLFWNYLTQPWYKDIKIFSDPE